MNNIDSEELNNKGWQSISCCNKELQDKLHADNMKQEFRHKELLDRLEIDN